MKGEMKLQGKLEQVDINLYKGELIISVPQGADTTNWYHSVSITRQRNTVYNADNCQQCPHYNEREWDGCVFSPVTIHNITNDIFGEYCLYCICPSATRASADSSGFDNTKKD